MEILPVLRRTLLVVSLNKESRGDLEREMAIIEQCSIMF
jgi:hypothetical protein